MHDLALWRALIRGEFSSEAIASGLRQLAALPLAERVPYLGALDAALAHADPGARAAALGVVAGAGGVEAYRRLERALHDGDAAVREAALRALASSAEHDPARWIHALFHRDLEQRRAALRIPAPPGAEWQVAYLLADPECRALAADQAFGARLPARLLPMLLRHSEDDPARAADARRLIAKMPRGEVETWLHAAAARTPFDACAIINAANQGQLEQVADPRDHDPWDRFFDIFWDLAPDSDAARHHPEQWEFLQDFARGVMVVGLGHADRIARCVAAILLTARRRGAWNSAAAEICAALRPRMLTWDWIPRDTRRHALHGLYALGSNCPRHDEALVRDLLASSVCRRDTGRLDLWAIGGAAHLLPSQPYQRLRSWLSLDELVEGFLESPREAAALFSLPDKCEASRLALIQELLKRAPLAPQLPALVVAATPSDGLSFLKDFDAARFVGLFQQLQALCAAGLKLSTNKTRVLGELIGRGLLRQREDQFFDVWLSSEEPWTFPLGREVLSCLARELRERELFELALGLPTPGLRKFLHAVAWCSGFPHEREMALARQVVRHADSEIRAWAAARLPGEKSFPARTPGAAASARRLEGEAADRIAECDETLLAEAVRPCAQRPHVGVAAALARRAGPGAPNLTVCVALLGCHDAPPQIDAQFHRYASDDRRFLRELDAEVADAWNSAGNLPWLGRVWLHRWERHLLPLARELAQRERGLESLLEQASGFTSPVLRDALWSVARNCLALARHQRVGDIGRCFTPELARRLVQSLTTSEGGHAARMLMDAFAAPAARPALESERALATRVLPDASREVRDIVRPWLDSRGCVEAAPPPSAASAPSETLLTQVRASRCLTQLAAWCADVHATLAQTAAERLVELGERGAQKLLKLLRAVPAPPHVLLLAETVKQWPARAARQAAALLPGDATVDPRARFVVALCMLESPPENPADAEQLVAWAAAAANEPATIPWLRLAHWERLVAAAPSVERVARALATAPHPHAHTNAVLWLMERVPPEPADTLAVRAFLDGGRDRAAELRWAAAEWLRKRGDMYGLPLLLVRALASPGVDIGFWVGCAEEELRAIVAACLTAGDDRASESRLLDWLRCDRLPAEARQHGLHRLAADATRAGTREAAIALLRRSPLRAGKIRRVAEACAWGVLRGRELTGQMFSIELLGGDGLGHTRLEKKEVHVNPLPILRGEQNGREVVEGLILHEIGHHLCHSGDEAQAVWKEAEKHGLHGLLNLVADEHLERNLRANDRGFGDRLKKLAAYAFRHSTKETPVDTLFDGLQHRAAAVLCATRPRVARKRGHVLVENGELLRQLEMTGQSFARFMRALRMGLGNRHDDPRVAEALALFDKGFRKRDMRGLLSVAQKLREIFGLQCAVLEGFGQDAAVAADHGDTQIHGEGLTNDELREEIRRITDPKQLPRRGPQDDAASDAAARWINVIPEEKFQTIDNIQVLNPSAEAHAPLAAAVARPAARLRRYFEELGVRLEPQRRRATGSRVDRGRLPDLLLRGDPRLLISRRARFQTDLFLGVAIDCSGSMNTAGNIEKAKRFGALLAEATRGLEGVDLRLFGFRDDVIFDAGDAVRPAVAALEAGGGNNDAAGLWHAARHALASRRRAKLLVMISDGLPTQCTVSALRALVTRLTTRLGICCAQVAVCPLEEVCFSNYVLLENNDVGASVRAFGGVVAKLVRKALRR